jgi:hypothetical protein
MAITFDNNTNLNHMLFFNSVANTYTNRNLTTGAYFNNNSVAGDILYFSWSRAVWHDLTLTVGTALVADAITIVWEYWNASTWQTLTVTDGTSNFTTSGTVSFAVPDGWRWRYRADGTTNAYSGFMIRARITSVTNLTNGGANATTAVYGKDWTVKLDGGVAYRISDIQSASDSGSWGIATTTGKCTNITASLWLNGSGTSFTVRDNEMLEIGLSVKRRRFISDAGTIITIGYKDSTGYLAESSMIRYWNETLVGSDYNRHRATFNIYASILSMEQGGFFDGGFFGVVNFEQAQLECSVTATGNFYLDTSTTGSISNTTFMTNGTAYIYASAININTLFLSRSDGILCGVGTQALITNTDFQTNKLFRIGNSNCTGTVRDCIFRTSFTAQVQGVGTNNTARVEYSVTLSIKDVAGNNITSPNVKITNNVGTVLFNGAWSTPQNILVWKETSSVETDYNPITITISKAGYETYESTAPITSKYDEIITLKPALDTMLVLGKGIAIKADPTNNTQDRDLLIMN